MPDATPAATKKESSVSFSTFLAKVSPFTPALVLDFYKKNSSGVPSYVSSPAITVHCSTDICDGDCLFDHENTVGDFYSDAPSSFILIYKCRHCGRSYKSFALVAQELFAGGNARLLKLGETPPFGPPTPARLVSMIGPDRETFLKGRRSENNGLGLGAFTYYRRVVENQKTRLIDAIIEVAEKVNCPPEMIEILKNSKSKTQFSEAVDQIKDAIPQVLLVDGHNPLTLLHGALSKGIHAKTDEECLEMAEAIRVVLGDMAERMGQVLKEQRELKQALSKLMASPKPTPQTTAAEESTG